MAVSGNKEWTARNYREVGRFFGVSRQTIDLWRKQGMPGQRGNYHLDVIAQWRLGRGAQEAREDPLELQRMERAKLLTLQRREREGELVRLPAISTALNQFARQIREAGDRLQRLYGPDAHDLLNSAIDAALDQLDRACRDRKSNGQGVSEPDGH